MNTVARKMVHWYRVVHKWKFATVSLERAKCMAKTHLLRTCDFERKKSTSLAYLAAKNAIRQPYDAVSTFVTYLTD